MTEAADSPVPVTAIAAVQAVVDNKERLGLTWDMKPATVISLNPTRAAYDGDNVPIFMTNLTGRLEIGQRVMATSVPPAGNFILGSITDMTLLTVSNHFQSGAPTQTQTSLTAAVVNSAVGTPFAVNINKKFTNTALAVWIAGTFYATGTDAGPLFSVFITGVTGANAGTYNNAHNLAGVNISNATVNRHTNYAGYGVIPSIGKGIATVTLRWVRATGTGTLTIDTNDLGSMIVQEVWPS